MKVSTDWLRSSLGRTISDREIADKLEQAGLEVEQLISSKPLDKNIKTALVKKVIQHPDADRLKIVSIESGEYAVDVVCGAPNVRQGMIVAWASPGSTLPDGQNIEVAALRGVKSQGMLCSGRELAMSHDDGGILVLDPTTPVGIILCDIIKFDAIVDVKTHANRFDLLSVLGLVREIAAQAGETYQWEEPGELVVGEGPAVTLEADENLVPRFCLAYVKLPGGVNPTTTEHARWLSAAGMRTISPLVDWTNLIMLEQGQPLHAYDAAKVKLPMIVRHAKDGERLTTLDGVNRLLSTADIIIADGEGPLGLAGVMGGARAEVGEDTTEILLEAATFDAATVRKMAKRHNLRSEASSRFERGLPTRLAPLALACAARAIGGDVVGTTDNLRVWPWVQRIGLRSSTLSRLLGFEVSREEAVAALGRLGIEAMPFDIVAEAKKHLGKPYIWGASYKTNGADGFDCGYLVDYIYSLIGAMIGHSAPQLMASGRAIELADLKPGDTLYRDGTWKKLKREERDGVSHVAMYIGDGKIIHAENYMFDDGKWVEMPQDQQRVMIDPLEVITSVPGFLGARRHVENLDDFISVPAVPWWRPDLKLAEDLVEEVVRIIGYDRVPATLPPWRPPEVQFDRIRPRLWRLQDLLQGLGTFEIMTYSFVSEQQLTSLGYDPKMYLKLRNPLSLEQAYMRRELLPSLLAAASSNAHYNKSVAIYELSKVFIERPDGAQPAEPTRLGILVREPADALPVLRGMLERLIQTLPTPLTVEAAEVPLMIRGRCGQIKLDTKVIGSIGQLLPDLVRARKLSGEVAYLEIDIEPIITQMSAEKSTPLPRFPTIKRDISLDVPVNTSWAMLQNILKKELNLSGEFISDYYQNDNFERKFLTFRLTLGHPDRTMTETEAEAIVGAANKVLASRVDIGNSK